MLEFGAASVVPRRVLAEVRLNLAASLLRVGTRIEEACEGRT